MSRASRAPRKVVFVVAYLALWSVRRGRRAAAIRAGIPGPADQLTPLKRACLSLCRVPEVRPLRYGLACLGASWPLMGILFVVGVMSYLWIAVVALWIAAEKAFHWGGGLAAAAGVGLIGWGGVGLLL